MTRRKHFFGKESILNVSWTVHKLKICISICPRIKCNLPTNGIKHFFLKMARCFFSLKSVFLFFLKSMISVFPWAFKMKKADIKLSLVINVSLFGGEDGNIIVFRNGSENPMAVMNDFSEKVQQIIGGNESLLSVCLKKQPNVTNHGRERIVRNIFFHFLPTGNTTNLLFFVSA